TGYSLKDKNQAKTDKTEHEMEEREKVKVKVKINPKSQQVKAEDETEEILSGQPDCPDSEASRAHSLSFDHKSFTSSASFGKSDILI
ncbi:hypothetical protein Tco_0567396, partial [Tanacetum coccineum]